MELRDKYLWDIHQAIEKIHSFTNNRGLRYDIFEKDTLYQDAVHWNIMVIGEAMKKLIDIDPNINITEPRRIINCRNFIIHAYDSLKPDIIWAIVIKDLPLLAKEIESFGFSSIFD